MVGWLAVIGILLPADWLIRPKIDALKPDAMRMSITDVQFAPRAQGVRAGRTTVAEVF